MSTAEFLSQLRERDVRLWVEDGRLKVDAPPGVVDAELREQLAARKPELLAVLDGARRTLEAPRALVPLKPTGDLPPLFARAGHNGDVFAYRALAELLDPRRPLYGLEPLGLDGSPVPDSVEEIAAYEVAQLRGLQPEGPYHLAGFCAGGTIAFEAARQLVRDGHEVARLLLIGAPFPTVYRSSPLLAQLRSIPLRVDSHVRALAAGGVAEGAGYVRDRLRRRVEEAHERRDPALDDRRRVEAATLAAVARYEPPGYGGRVDLVMPSAAWRTSGDRPHLWRGVAGDVVEHVGPDGATGDTVLLPPHVRATADLVNDALGKTGPA